MENNALKSLYNDDYYKYRPQHENCTAPDCEICLNPDIVSVPRYLGGEPSAPCNFHLQAVDLFERRENADFLTPWW